MAARADIDSWNRYGLFPACPSNLKTIPVLIRPGAYLFALFDQQLGWNHIRTLPMLLLITLSAVTAYYGNSGKQRLLMCAAFIGVTGGGLILMRPEFIVLLHLLLCMITFAAARRQVNLLCATALVLLHFLAVSLSLAIHLQGLLLLPLSALSLIRLLNKHTALAIISISLIATTAWQGLGLHTFHCSEQPAFEAIMAKNQGSVTPLIEPENRLIRYYERAQRYTWHAAYKRYFNPPYVPAVTGTVKILNVPIGLIIAGNALGVAFVLFSGLRMLWARYKNMFSTPWRQTLKTIIWDPWVLLTGCAATLTFYALYDITGTFYRAFFINFLAVMLIAFAATHYRHSRIQRILGTYAFIAFLTCLASTLVNYYRIVPALRDGYTGPSTALSTDWKKISEDVAALKQQCSIPDGAKRVIADDLSYQALRSHPHLIDFIYIYTNEVIQRIQYDDATPAQRLEKLRAVKPGGAIVKCKSLDFFSLPHAAKRGDLCCLKP